MVVGQGEVVKDIVQPFSFPVCSYFITHLKGCNTCQQVNYCMAAGFGFRDRICCVVLAYCPGEKWSAMVEIVMT